jgi:hypothetical protein
MAQPWYAYFDPVSLFLSKTPCKSDRRPFPLSSIYQFFSSLSYSSSWCCPAHSFSSRFLFLSPRLFSSNILGPLLAGFRDPVLHIWRSIVARLRWLLNMLASVPWWEVEGHTRQSAHLSPNLSTLLWQFIDPLKQDQRKVTRPGGECIRSSLHNSKSSWMLVAVWFE